jgi:AcrR family transcriptional regulator
MIVDPRQAAPGPEAGRRERLKHERRARIEAAARTIFRAKGFAATSTREIAAAAGVGAGTLYAYATSKLALLRMVYRHDLESVTRASFAALPDGSVLDQLVHVFRARFELWGADPALSRYANLATFSAQYDGPGMPDEERLERALSQALVAFVAEAQRAGRIDARDDAALIARTVLDIYLTECREWVLEAHPIVDDAVARLRPALELALRGVLTDAERASTSGTRVERFAAAIGGLTDEAVDDVLRFAAFRATHA